MMRDMRYIICVLLPPLAVLRTGKMGAFVLSMVFTLMGWIPGVMYSILITDEYFALKRQKELMTLAKARFK
jgi:uncharacterized membrane protein YqaE (UPF0057 family)